MVPALENEVLLNPKPSLVDRSVLGLSADKLVPPDIYVDRALLRGRLGYDDVCEAGGARRGHRSPWGDSLDADTDPVAKAKARIQELQMEADTLEEAYRNYQQRAVHSTVSHMLPQRTRSPQAAHPLQHSPLRKHIPNPSHSRSPKRSKASHSLLSPQTTRVAFAALCEKTVPTARPKVVFSEERNQDQPTVYSLSSPPPFLKEGGSQDESSSTSRHLSSSWNSSPKKTLRKKTTEGNSKLLHILLF